MSGREDRATWSQSLSIADAMTIQALDEPTRAAVERYRRATAWEIATNLSDAAMGHGWLTSEALIEGEVQYVLDRAL